MKVLINADDDLVIIVESEQDTMDIMRWKDKSSGKITIAKHDEMVNNPNG